MLYIMDKKKYDLAVVVIAEFMFADYTYTYTQYAEMILIYVSKE